MYSKALPWRCGTRISHYSDMFRWNIFYLIQQSYDTNDGTFIRRLHLWRPNSSPTILTISCLWVFYANHCPKKIFKRFLTFSFSGSAYWEKRRWLQKEKVISLRFELFIHLLVLLDRILPSRRVFCPFFHVGFTLVFYGRWSWVNLKRSAPLQIYLLTLLSSNGWFQCGGFGMFIPDPDIYPSRTSDPESKNSNKREGWKKNCHNFLCSHKFH